MSGYSCPECGEPVLVRRTLGGAIPIGLHRDSHGKHCPASGKNLIHYRWKELFRAVTGMEPKRDG